MQIVKDYPPNIELIKANFQISGNTVFCYGDTLYNPGGYKISSDLLAHEKVHQKQQGNDPSGWWRRYIEDKAFRLSQEVEAYRKQFRVYKNSLGHISFKNRLEKEQAFLNRIATDLSSALYGSLISLPEAKRRIEQ